MGGLVTLVSIIIGMYRIAERSQLVGWVWAAVTVGVFLLEVVLIQGIPSVVLVGLCGIITYFLMFGYKVAYDK